MRYFMYLMMKMTECGKAHETDEAMIVALEEVFERDNSIATIAGLPYGCEAERKDESAEWEIRGKQDEQTI